MIIQNPELKKNIGRVLIVIFSVILVFHFFVLIRIIPYTIVWGGRLQNTQQMYGFEIVSILLNSFFLFVILMERGYIRRYLSVALLKVILWIMIFLFSLNTFGNLNSLNQLESILFTPITFLLALFCFLLV
ncbi:hypothetical protein JWG45_11320 [Leptospira sp. 201903070]|jgi:hypothetical protein|uniref:Histidine kinase n=1 Tax=Leptospira ainlahdjerensis TaxID=2810033 RepID=A0ABS2UEV4_9LEPT|nr:hypothetical protein [Leptospira ainlahdjerensis]MBM9577678.1 hypothetical protein [Leptospira ainlahdjerensis]MBM9577742.1 hypothetical protein [Leptospira ainlahdjerensis]